MRAAAALCALGLLAAGITFGSPAAGACTARTVVAVGGWNDGQGTIFPPGSVDVRVRYSGTLGDLEGGVAALSDTVRGVRAGCPGTQLAVAGYSQGAAITHLWLQRNPGVPNKVGVLLGDPKQAPRGMYFPDPDFGGAPTLALCRVRDGVCNSTFDGWVGYFTGEHGRYPFDQIRSLAGRTGTVWLP